MTLAPVTLRRDPRGEVKPCESCGARRPIAGWLTVYLRPNDSELGRYALGICSMCCRIVEGELAALGREDVHVMGA